MICMVMKSSGKGCGVKRFVLNEFCVQTTISCVANFFEKDAVQQGRYGIGVGQVEEYGDGERCRGGMRVRCYWAGKKGVVGGGGGGGHGDWNVIKTRGVLGDAHARCNRRHRNQQQRQCGDAEERNNGIHFVGGKVTDRMIEGWEKLRFGVKESHASISMTGSETQCMNSNYWGEVVEVEGICSYNNSHGTFLLFFAIHPPPPPRFPLRPLSSPTPTPTSTPSASSSSSTWPPTGTPAPGPSLWSFRSILWLIEIYQQRIQIEGIWEDIIPDVIASDGHLIDVDGVFSLGDEFHPLEMGVHGYIYASNGAMDYCAVLELYLDLFI